MCKTNSYKFHAVKYCAVLLCQGCRVWNKLCLILVKVACRYVYCTILYRKLDCKKNWSLCLHFNRKQLCYLAEGSEDWSLTETEQGGHYFCLCWSHYTNIYPTSREWMPITEIKPVTCYCLSEKSHTQPIELSLFQWKKIIDVSEIDV